MKGSTRWVSVMLASATAVTSPKTTFSGTTIATIVRLRLIAEIAAGVVTESMNAPIPSSKVR